MKKIFIFICVLHAYNVYTSDLDIKPLKELLPTHPEIEYIKCHDAQLFEYKPFPISKFPELQPHEGLFAETFIIKIPHGKVCSFAGWIKIDDIIIQEFLPQNRSHEQIIKGIKESPFFDLKKISGKVAVVTTIDAFCYGHWIQDILGRLALLEQKGIEYDWIYIPNLYRFQKETLALWGINPAKIIDPTDDVYIQAEELIVPSYTAKRAPQENIPFLEHVDLVCYFTTTVINALRNRFLPLAEQYESEYPQNFAKKIFISRQKAGSRKIINEDDVFSLFAEKGFTRYWLENLSILQQIILFKNAEIIVAPNGSGLTNIIFCKHETKIVEIFGARSDCCFYFLAQTAGLKNYQYIQTIEFEHIGGHFDTYVPLSKIKPYINTL